MKLHGFGRTDNVTLGLPFMNISVDHGTVLTLAGSGQAQIDSLLAVLQFALKLTKQRHA